MSDTGADTDPDRGSGFRVRRSRPGPTTDVPSPANADGHRIANDDRPRPTDADDRRPTRDTNT